MSTQQTEVAVVGGGPVGLGLAIELGRRGVSVVVLERHETLHDIPKGQNLTQRTMEHFRAWGVEEAIRDARLMPAGYPAAGVNAYGNLASEHAHPWFRRSTVGQYYFASNERLPQYSTERVLRRRLEDLPTVELRFGTARTVAQDARSAWVEVDDGRIEAQYVVGCDGSRSLVRQQSGIGEWRSDHERRMVLLVLRSPTLHSLLEDRFGQASFFNVLDPEMDGYWRFLGRVDVGEQFFFHCPVPVDATAETVDAHRLVSDTVGAEIPMQVDYVGFWDLRFAIADTYQQGRILIAGDAAHSHPPYGGYGINTGFEDARNLGWKLAADLGGWGGADLLSSYTEERRPVFASTARQFIEAFIERDRLFVAAHGHEEGEAFAEAWRDRAAGSMGVTDYEPHYQGSSLVFGPEAGVSGAVGSHSFDPRPGHRLPAPARGNPADRWASLGEGFTVLTGAGGSRLAARLAAAADRGVPMTTGEDPELGSTVVVVRPDHYVSWVGTQVADPAAVVARSTGRSAGGA